MKKLDFNQEYILENDVVKLTPLKRTDLEILIEFGESEPTLWTYSLMSADGRDNMRRYLDKAIESREEGTSYPFLIFDKRVGAFAGSTRFYDYSAHHNTVQLGYTWYGQRFWGTGLNKNCKLLMLQFAFEELGLDRVEFRADNNNERSIAAMRSIGCTVEGVLRSNCASPSGRRDSIILSILRDEWLSGIAEVLSQKALTDHNNYLSRIVQL